MPKELRDRVGLRPGEVDIEVDGAGLRLEPVAGEALEEHGGRLLVPASGVSIDDADVRALREADQR